MNRSLLEMLHDTIALLRPNRMYWNYGIWCGSKRTIDIIWQAKRYLHFTQMEHIKAVSLYEELV